jgi:hypothetical protein
MSCETLEGSKDLLWALLEQVLTTIVKAVEWCIMGEHMGAIERRIVPDDHLLIVEDLVALKRYFVQRDEDGVVNGLDEEKVAATEQINRRKAPLLLVIWLLISVGWGLGLWLNPWWELLMIPAVALLVRRPRDTLF